MDSLPILSGALAIWILTTPGGVAAQGTTIGAQPAVPAAEGACISSELRFDTSSVERIILDPEGILDDPERFWREDEAYRLVALWHDNTRTPRDLNAWRGSLERLAALSPEEREVHSDLLAARQLAGLERRFVSQAVPHLCAFLPPDADLSTTIHFTTEIMAAGFQQSGSIVIHILNHDVVNLFVHEVFHRGFASIYKKYVTTEIESDPLRLAYLMLQNEGMATYAAYRALSIFPEIGEVGRSLVATDYDLLGKPEEVSRLRTELSELLALGAVMDADELRTRAWQTGVRDRAYYVVGAHMAQVIDRELGREVLVETIKTRPASFVRVYNSIVGDSLAIPAI